MQKSTVWLGSFAILCIMVGGYTGQSFLSLMSAPLFLILLFIRDDWRVALTVLGIAFLLLGFSGDWLASTILVVTTGGLSAILGHGFRTNSLRAVIPLATLVIVVYYLLIFVELRLAGYSVASYMSHQALLFMEQSGQSGSLAGTTAADWLLAMEGDVNLYLPTFITIFAVLVTLFEVVVVRFILRRDNAFQPLFRAIRFPLVVVVLFALSLLCVMAGIGEDLSLFWELVNNLWLISTFLLALQAVSLLWWLLRTRPFAIAIICVAVALMTIPVVVEIYVLAGMTDVMFDIRKRISQRR